MIRYTDSLEGIAPAQLSGGFFEGWPNPPSPETHLKILKNSDYTMLAIDEETGQVVGFITAISDGTLSAYIPLLEVLPAYRRRGIGVARLELSISRGSSKPLWPPMIRRHEKLVEFSTYAQLLPLLSWKAWCRGEFSLQDWPWKD